MRQYIKYALNKLKPSRVIKDIYGISYYDSRLDALTRHIAINKVYEEYKEIEEFIFTYKLSFDTAIDVGANCGLITLPLSKKFKKVISFEPDPSNFQSLNKNISLNSAKNILCHQLAVADSPGVIQLSVNRIIDGDGMINSGLSSLHKKNRVFSKDIVNTDVITIDDYCFQNGIDDLSFLKIDTEGYEHLTLLEALETIKSSLPAIFYEFSLTLDNRCGDDSRKKSFNFLHQLGYSHYYLVENVFKELNHREVDSIQKDINLFAIHSA